MSRRAHSVTTLDEFARYYYLGEHFNGDEYTTDDWCSFLTNGIQPSAAMEAGTAVHSVLETAEYGELPIHHSREGWLITFALDGELVLPEIRESRVSRTYHGFELRGRVDSMTATTVRDIKTTGNPDVERYLNSWQWKTYLWMTGAQEFWYDILKVSVYEDRKEVVVQDHIPVQVRRYPDLDRDVEKLLDDYLECLSILGITEG